MKMKCLELNYRFVPLCFLSFFLFDNGQKKGSDEPLTNVRGKKFSEAGILEQGAHSDFLQIN